MEIKTQPPVKVLYSTHRTTIPQLGEFAGTIARQLYTEAVAAGALVSGPQHWIYHGADGKPDTVFTLEIALPVQGDITSAAFGVKELPPFKALAYLHEGPWENMPQSYSAMLQHIDQYKIVLTDECRELYYNVDFNHPEHNRTEILLGIL